MNDRTENTDKGSWPAQLTELEARLPIPDDVIVVECDLPSPGPVGIWSPRRRVILLRAGLCREERLFTLAHELAHCLLGHTVDGPAEEAEADAFAERLVVEATL